MLGYLLAPLNPERNERVAARETFLYFLQRRDVLCWF
jgi:hypothetical protein